MSQANFIKKINYGTKTLGHTTYFFHKIDSTNKMAAKMAKDGAPVGSIVIADEQTAGKGRFNRYWHSPKGKGLWFSLILKPDVELERISQLTIVISVALAEALDKLYKLPLGIKWPNDLLINGKKISGILSEASIEENRLAYVIMGIGLNISLMNDEESSDLQTASSLEGELGFEIDKDQLLKEILQRIEYWYERWQREGFEPIRKLWKEKTVTLGQKVEIDFYGEIFAGIAKDIGEDGSLLVENDKGQVRSFNSGEISLRKKKT